jgi:antitoxin VapB
LAGQSSSNGAEHQGPDVDRLARLAAMTGESITAAVGQALTERLERVQGAPTAERRRAAIRRAQAAFAAMPVDDGRSADEIVGYDEHGLPA